MLCVRFRLGLAGIELERRAQAAVANISLDGLPTPAPLRSIRDANRDILDLRLVTL